MQGRYRVSRKTKARCFYGACHFYSRTIRDIWHRPFASRRETAKCGIMTDTLQPKFLGAQSALPQTPEEAQLDYVPNPRPGTLYLARFAVPEFTSLCPVTAQPDFAHLVIDYAPDATIVESKSLKLFLGSFRNRKAASF
jgi:hypothetical protein